MLGPTLNPRARIAPTPAPGGPWRAPGLTIGDGPDGALCQTTGGGTVDVAPGGAFAKGGEMLVVLGVVLAVLLLVFWVLKGQVHR